jgi:peptidyl-prolyl cis-trans isomerase SurA
LQSSRRLDTKMYRGIPMKNLLWIVPAVFFGLINHIQAQTRTVDRILAQVNDEIITMSELNRELTQFKQELATRYSGEQLEQMIQKAEKQALENLIEQKLVYQKAVELGITANVDSRVSAAVQEVLKQNNLKDTDELENELGKQGMTLRDFRDAIRKKIVNDDLIGEFVGSRITLLTPEIDKYYKDHQAEFSTPEEVTLSEIVITIPDDDKAAQNKINDIRRRLEQGEAWNSLASQYSNGPTANKGGSIGTYIVSKLHSDIVKAIKGVKETEVSQPQKLKEGSYVIYRVDSRKEAGLRPLDQVRDDIKNTLYQKKFNPEYQRFVNQLKEDAYIQIFSEIK